MFDADDADAEFRTSSFGELCALAMVAGVLVWLARDVSTTFGSALTAVSVVIGIWWWTRLARRRLVVSRDGVAVRGAFAEWTAGWGDTYYTVSATEAAPRGNGPVFDAIWWGIRSVVRRVWRPRKRALESRLHVHDRRGHADDVDAWNGAHASNARIISTIHARAQSECTPFAVAPEGLKHDEEMVRFAAIDRVIITETLAVYAYGERRAWSTVSLAAIHNVWLLVAQLLEHGVSIEIDFAPPPYIRAAIDAAAERSAAMQRTVRQSSPAHEPSSSAP